MQLVTGYGANQGTKKMCQSPAMMPEVGAVACRNCWQCRANKVNDWVGRSIAEQKSSTATLAVTLTYRGDTPHAAHLVYADVQKFLKLVRAKGYKVRYIVAGEYGSKKGRAHWHAILFFQGKTPNIVDLASERKTEWDIVLDERINWTPWKHGFVFFQQPDYGGFRYMLKYLLKDLRDDTQRNHFAMSKIPPLGHKYFDRMAQQYVDQHLAPQSYTYAFPDQKDANQKRRKFCLQGKSRENFISAFLTKWEEKHGTIHPLSEVIDEHLDKMTDLEADWTDADWKARLNYKPVRYVSPDPVTPLGGEPEDCELLHVTYEGIPMKVYQYEDRPPIIETEGTLWHVQEPKQIELLQKTWSVQSRQRLHAK